MVRVQVRQADVRLLQADAELLKPREQRLAALLAPEAGVYEQAALPGRALDQVGVQVPQGVLRQGDVNAENVAFYLCIQALSPLKIDDTSF